MAQLSSILSFEQATGSAIHLHQEGIFWRVYEQSAYLFSKLTNKSFKFNKRHFKIVDRNIISLGFPHTVLDKYLSGFRSEYLNDKHIVISEIDFSFDMDDYLNWHSSIPFSDTANRAITPKLINPEQSILDRLSSFRLDQSTAIDCLIFVNQLQKDLLLLRNNE